jgi:NADH-quinone oxidoreductase subunit N
MNYADLFRVTLPETALEIAALLVLVVDLGFLRKAALRLRVAVAALLGMAGCGAAIWALFWSTGTGNIWGLGLANSHELLLVSTFYVGAAQTGILLLTAVTLTLLVGSDFTRHIGEYVAVVLMAAAGGLLVAGAQDLLVIFVGLELLSLGLYILTGFAKSSGKSAEAALKYYLFGGMSAAFLLFGFSYFYGMTGSTNLVKIQEAIVASVPFHLWAPDTYEGAPAPAAAFIASVSKVASFTLLISLSLAWLRPGEGSGAWPQLAGILMVLAAASMIVGNLAALAQVSVRRLLAYSAIAHAGYMLLGIAFIHGYAGQSGPSDFSKAALASTFSSANAVLYYILTYGLTTIGAFGVVDVVERATGSDKLDAFLGLHKRNPALAAVLLVLFLSLAGIPPLVGFWAKFNLFAAVLGVSAGPVPFALVALAVAFSAVSLYYYLQVLKRAYVMPAVDETSGNKIHAHPVTLAVLVLIAVAVVVLGCFPALLQGWIASFYPVL